jgi:type II secretory pathway component PulJ
VHHDGSYHFLVALWRTKEAESTHMNLQKTLIAVLAALSASFALADDFKTTSGKEYKDATVTHVEPDGIVVRSKSGISKIYFAELPPEVQQRFHYDPQTAAAAQANEMAATQQTNQQIGAADQQKTLESQLSQLQQQEENLRVQIEQAKNAPRSKQPSKAGPSLATQAHEESLTAKGKERQLKRRQKEYEGAKQAAARNGLNANNLENEPMPSF